MMKLLQLVEKGDKEKLEELIKKDGLPIDAQWSDYSLLRHALCRGKIDIVKFLLEQGCRINKTVKSTINTPLHMAVKGEHIDVIKILLEKGALIDQKNHAGETPLNFAVKTKNDEIIDLIFEKLNNSENGQNENRSFFEKFHIACMRNHISDVEKYLRSGVSVNKPISIDSPFWPSCTPLHLAVDCQHYDVMKKLLDHGADINAKNTKGMTPLHLAVQFNDLAIVSLMFDTLKYRGEYVNVIDDRGFSHFHAVCTCSDASIVENFLKTGVDINSKVSSGWNNWSGYTPLHFAVAYDRPRTVKLLVDHGADITLKNDEGKTPLHLAVQREKNTLVDIIASSQSTSSKLANPVDEYGFSHFHATCLTKHWKIVLAYLEQGEPVNQSADSPRWPMYTPLHLAMASKCRELVKMLLDRGADVNARTSNDMTALHMAVKLGDQELVKMLIHYGANVNCATKRELTTPLHLAVLGQHAEIVERLLKEGADMSARTGGGRAPLHMVARGNHNPLEENHIQNYIKIIMSFVDAGCDIDIQDSRGKTPLFRSGENLNACSAYALLQCGADIYLANGATANFEDDSAIKTTMSRLIMNIFTRHREKLSILKMPANDLEEKSDDPKYIREVDPEDDSDYYPVDYAQRCIKELIRLQDIQIDSYTSLYSLLFKNPIEMSYHVLNEKLTEILASQEFDKSFPYYAYLVRLQFRKGNATRITLDPSKKALETMTRLSLPDNCSESILKNLTAQEVNNLISANPKTD